MLDDEQRQQIPKPLRELTQHCLIKGIQLGSVCTSIFIVPYQFYRKRNVYSLKENLSRVGKYSMHACVLSTSASLLLMHWKLSKENYDEYLIWERAYRIRHSESQQRVDRYSICASVLGGSIALISGLPTRLSPLSFVKGSLLSVPFGICFHLILSNFEKIKDWQVARAERETLQWFSTRRNIFLADVEYRIFFLQLNLRRYERNQWDSSRVCFPLIDCRIPNKIFRCSFQKTTVDLSEFVERPVDVDSSRSSWLDHSFSSRLLANNLCQRTRFRFGSSSWTLWPVLIFSSFRQSAEIKFLNKPIYPMVWTNEMSQYFVLNDLWTFSI